MPPIALAGRGRDPDAEPLIPRLAGPVLNSPDAWPVGPVLLLSKTGVFWQAFSWLIWGHEKVKALHSATPI